MTSVLKGGTMATLAGEVHWQLYKRHYSHSREFARPLYASHRIADFYFREPGGSSSPMRSHLAVRSCGPSRANRQSATNGS